MIEIRGYDEIGVEQWDRFVSESKSAWFVHTSMWQDLILNLGFSRNNEKLSFGIYQNGRLVAVIPLIMERISGTVVRRELSFTATNTPYPAFSDSLSRRNRNKLEKLIFARIFEVPNVDFCGFYVCPLTEEVLNKDVITNPLPSFGFHDTTLSTNIVELEKSEKDLFARIRKGTKSDIKTAKKNGHEVEIINGKELTNDKVDIYRNLHSQAAGRQTRPDVTWEMMSQWIENDLSLLALGKKKGAYVSAAFVNTYKKKAYYQSGATFPESEREKGIGHLMQWEIIKYLNSQGFTHYELGWNWYANISQEVADEKMLGIARFKAGFGGDVYPLFRGELYKNKEYMKRVFEERLNKYLADSFGSTGTPQARGDHYTRGLNASVSKAEYAADPRRRRARL